MESSEQIAVLYVGDDAETRHNVSDLLTRCVSRLYTTANGQEGVAQFRPHQPDIVVCYIAIPDMNVLEMARLIKQLAPETEIIILTDCKDSTSQQECSSIGITRYLRGFAAHRKPLSR